MFKLNSLTLVILAASSIGSHAAVVNLPPGGPINGASSVTNENNYVYLGSLNLGSTNYNNTLSINNSNMAIKDYFSISFCGGMSSGCPPINGVPLKTVVDIQNGSRVAAMTTIVGDGGRGELNISSGSRLDTSKLWISGNDNSVTPGAADNSTGAVVVTGRSTLNIVRGSPDNTFPRPLTWDLTSATQGGYNVGDAVLGKTGYGRVDVLDNSTMNIGNDFIISTGVPGVPNTRASTINIASGSKINVARNVDGGSSAAGKLDTFIDGAGSEFNVAGNFTVGTGSGSVINTTLTNDGLLNVTGDIAAGTGAGSTANFNVGGTIRSRGNATLGSGDNSTVTLVGTNGTIQVDKRLIIGQGANGTTSVTTDGTSITAENLNIGNGNDSTTTADFTRSSVHADKEFVIGQGDRTTNTIDLSDTDFTATDIKIGQGSETVNNITLDSGSNINANTINIANGAKSTANMEISNSNITATDTLKISSADETSVDLNMDGGTLSAKNLVFGEGHNSVITMDLKNARIESSENAAFAVGNASRADITLTNSTASLHNAIVGKGAGAITNIGLVGAVLNSTGTLTLGDGENSQTTITSDGGRFGLNNINIGVGKNAVTTLQLTNRSAWNAAGTTVIGDGDDTTNIVNLETGSSLRSGQVMMGKGARSKNTVNITGGSVFDFGASNNSVIGLGNESETVLNIENGRLTGGGTLTLAAGDNSTAELNLKDNAYISANSLSLATGEDSVASVIVTNRNSTQFNPGNINVGKGRAYLELDSANGFNFDTTFTCSDLNDCEDTYINIKQGAVTAAGRNDWLGLVRIAENASLTSRGERSINGKITIEGKNSKLDINGYNQNVVSVDNRSLLNLGGSDAGARLDIKGDYLSDKSSQVNFNVLGSRDADVITVGGNTAGTSGINVRNVGGKAKRNILLIDVEGQSDGYFYLNSVTDKNNLTRKPKNNTVTFGAFNYELEKIVKDWYLHVDMRPEPGAFIHNSKAMLSMFSIERYDIPGQSRYPTLFSDLYNNGVWIRSNHRSGKNSEIEKNLDTSYNQSMMQLGADIYNWTNGYDFVQIGTMAGMGTAQNSTRSISGKNATGNVSGYSAGLYAVLQQNKTDGLTDSHRQGLWGFGAMQYMDFGAKVKGPESLNMSYGGGGVNFTGEVGYLKKVSELDMGIFFVEPKVVVSHTQLFGASSATDPNGVIIKYPNVASVIKPGVRMSLRNTANQVNPVRDDVFSVSMPDAMVDSYVGVDYALTQGNQNEVSFDSDKVKYKKNSELQLNAGTEFLVFNNWRVLIDADYSPLGESQEIAVQGGVNYQF